MVFLRKISILFRRRVYKFLSYIFIINLYIMSALDNIVFNKKKFSDILEEIYDNQKKKDKQISAFNI